MDSIIIPFSHQRATRQHCAVDDSLETLIATAHQKANAYLVHYDRLDTPAEQALFLARLKSKRNRARKNFDSIAIASATIALESICAPKNQAQAFTIINIPSRAITSISQHPTPDTLG